MIALLQKDFRLYRAAFVAAAIVIVAPYLLAMIAMFYNLLSYPDRQISGIFEFASMFGVLGTIVVAAIFAGCAFSIERRDRSAEFLAMLPVSRWQIAISKLLVPIPVLCGIWLVHASSFFLVVAYEGRNAESAPYISGLFAAYALSSSAMILTFGIAWFAGVFLKSPAISASVALTALITSGFLIGLEYNDAVANVNLNAGTVFFFFAAITGILAFLIGILCYVKRVSP
jgi:ABC-type transport system involved in multi-copper enzyme maturation permease subunit